MSVAPVVAHIYTSLLQAMGRSRNMANKDLSVLQCMNAVSTWATAQPQIPILSKCGPKLATDSRAVTPDAYLQIRPLVETFLQIGLSSGVLQGWKLDEGLRRFLKNWPTYKDEDLTVDDIVSRFKMHVMSVFSLLRDARHEDVNCGNGKRWPRSGGFRTKCAKMNCSHLLQATLALMDHPDEDCSSPATSVALASSTTSAALAIDDDPSQATWPDLFTPPKNKSAQDSEWPSIFAPRSAVDIQIEPITPIAAKRKRQVKSSGQADKRKRIHEFRMMISRGSDRCEVCSMSGGVRTFWFATHRKSFGPGFIGIAEQVAGKIEKDEVDKDQAKDMLLKLKAARAD